MSVAPSSTKINAQEKPLKRLEGGVRDVLVYIYYWQGKSSTGMSLGLLLPETHLSAICGELDVVNYEDRSWGCGRSPRRNSTLDFLP